MSVIDTSFFQELDRFSFMVRKRVSTAYAGTRRSFLRGRGMEAVGYREYTQGDDFRTIDWKVYGRTEKLYVREFEEEKSLTTHILLDTSNSMKFGGKFEYGAMIALGFAYLVSKDNEKFGISTFAEKTQVSRPRRGKKYLSQSIDLLGSTEPGGRTRFSYCMEEYRSFIRSRSLVIVISDFMDNLDSIRNGVYRMADNELVVICVLDPVEWELPLEGEAKFVDLETGEKLDTYITPALQREYHRRIDDHVAGVNSVCSEVGADFHLFLTDTPVFDAIFEVISWRQKHAV